MLSSMLSNVWRVTILALLLVTPLRAAEERSQRYAVIVGVGEFADAQIKPRRHAEADAQALYDLFTSKDHLSIQKDHVHLLLGHPPAKTGAQPATHANILKAIGTVARQAHSNDMVFLVYLGSGAPLGERVCYFASDSTFKGRAQDAVAAAEIEHELEKLQSQHLCTLLDVNFKGFDAGREPSPDLNLTNLYKEFLDKEKEDYSPQHIVFFWNWGRTGSPDLEQHGLFAQVILDGLRGAADKDGYQPDGIITLDELKQHMSREVPALARKVGKTRAEKEQTFFTLGGSPSSFLLGHNPAASAKSQERLARFEKLAREQGLSAALVEEGERLLGRMPKLAAHRSLRREYQALVDGRLSLDDFQRERTQILDGMRLSESTARAFAGTVMNAINQVCEGYIKELEPGDMTLWAIRGLYKSVEEKVPQQLRQRLADSRGLSSRDLTELLKDARLQLGEREDLDHHKDIDHALQQMLRNLDPHTTYIDPDTLSQFRRDIEKNYTGVGIQIRKDAERDMILVVTPIKGSPAYRAGIRAGDILTRITRETDSEGNPLPEPEVLSTQGMPLSEAVKKVLGRPDTKVRLTIEREGNTYDLDIIRSYIHLETVLGYRRTGPNDSWDYWIDPESLIAYVRLASFAGSTQHDLEHVVRGLRGHGVKGLILDLRFNPGGLLRSAVAISDMFIDEGEIVSVRPRVGSVEVHRGKAGGYLDFEMVCLVNQGSASASEILSACLQDHRRAVIMGERSYGKGSVQNIQGFDGGQLKMTIATFWRPSGVNLNKASTGGKEEDAWGVVPEEGHRLKLSRTEREQLYEHLHDTEVIGRSDARPKDANSFKDRQLEMAVEYLRKQVRTAAGEGARKAG